MMMVLTGGGFIPMPPPAESAAAFMGALFGTGYFFPVLKITEIFAGLLLLTNRFVPLGLVLLSPIVVQIFLFHAFLDGAGLPMGIFLAGAMILLGRAYRSSFAGVLRSDAQPFW